MCLWAAAGQIVHTQCLGGGYQVIPTSDFNDMLYFAHLWEHRPGSWWELHGRHRKTGPVKSMTDWQVTTSKGISFCGVWAIYFKPNVGMWLYVTGALAIQLLQSICMNATLGWESSLNPICMLFLLYNTWIYWPYCTHKPCRDSSSTGIFAFLLLLILTASFK